MAESTENHGSLASILDRLVTDVGDIKSELAELKRRDAVGLRSDLSELKRIDTSVLQKHLVRKTTPKEPHYLFYDSKRQKVDHGNSMSWPPANGSGRPNGGVFGHRSRPAPNGGIFNYITDVLGHYQSVDWPYQVCDIEEYHPDTHKDTNNLYFLEPQAIFTEAWVRCLESIPQHAQGMLRDRKMALVLWFPHEGMNYCSGFHSEGWLHHFHLQMIKHQLENIICYFVFGDLQAQYNYDLWLRDRQLEEIRADSRDVDKTSFEFTKVISYDYFHKKYWMEYSERTGVHVNRLYNLNYTHQNHYGGSPLSGGFTDQVVIPYEDFDAQLLEKYPDPSIRGYYGRCKPTEVMSGVPTGQEKKKDLICLNARPRTHRPALVAELDRLGYNNDNSYVSFLDRDSGFVPDDHSTVEGVHVPKWKEQMYNNHDIASFIARKDTSYISFLSSDVQIEHVYKFWEDKDRVIADASTETVDLDDRLISSGMYWDSFFSLVSETLFVDDPNALFLTEKSFKPIAYRQPFMIVGSYGTLKYLRSLGYETFPEMFDESYDQEYDVQKRFDIIVKNLENWKQLSHDEKVAKYNSVRDKLKHNYEVFKNSRSTFERDTVTVLSQLSSRSDDLH